MTIQLKQLVEIPVDGVHIEGVLELPANAIGIVLFAHGSGSSRRSPRNNFVARVLREHGIGTLLMDLLTLAEDLDYQTRFDIPLLTRRLMDTTRWCRPSRQPATCRWVTSAPAQVRQPRYRLLLPCVRT